MRVRLFFLAIGLGLLSACGIDGAPTRPEPPETVEPEEELSSTGVNVTISGTASMGVGGGRVSR